MKSVICIRNDDVALRPLYRHLASLQNQPGKRYRARVLCTLLELGSVLLFAPNDPMTAEFVRAAKSVASDADDGRQPDGRPIRVELVLPDTLAMRPLLRRLADLPGGQGSQARSQMVLRALHAGVAAAYGDRPPQIEAPDAPKKSPAEQTAQAAQTPDMMDFIDHIEVGDLA